MTDRDIRALLRGATAAKVIVGWQGPHFAERTYCITPREEDPAERSLDDVLRFCQLLVAAGVAPLYRESDPLP